MGQTTFISLDPKVAEVDAVIVEDGEVHLSATLCLVAKLWTERPFIARAFHEHHEISMAPSEPWNLDDQVVLLRELTGDEQPSSLQLFMVPLWVKVYDIPFNLRSQKLVED
ncbi:hypothetical protein Tsubulata_045107 [Turnera subulata]|uniref:DUF4283 domain-containing protein n=1 Tax=Turnera subulata TaxID=218843 RepID=A0A9Q0JC86_9ROSI|nr:hypothetical protein Tsubulata_045107 [Turnera subulata]